jgi:hypothetical protein
MAQVLFNITMGTGLALSIDKNNPNPGNQLLLETSQADDPDQQWTWVFMPSTQASALYNPARNLFAAPKSLDKGAPVILFSPDMAINGNTTWQVLQQNGSAIRPPSDEDLNLNALGDDWKNGTPVGIYSWGGGDPNERWTSRVVAN